MLLSEAEGFFKNVGGNIVHPKDKKELINEIRIRLNRGQYNLNDIDTSEITDMSLLFKEFVHYDLSKWDVSKVEYMKDMFYGCTSKSFRIPNWAKGRV